MLENLLFMVTILMIKSNTLLVPFPAKWQANSNAEVVQMPWYDLLIGYFVDYLHILVQKGLLWLFIHFSPTDYF